MPRGNHGVRNSHICKIFGYFEFNAFAFIWFDGFRWGYSWSDTVYDRATLSLKINNTHRIYIHSFSLTNFFPLEYGFSHSHSFFFRVILFFLHMKIEFSPFYTLDGIDAVKNGNCRCEFTPFDSGSECKTSKWNGPFGHLSNKMPFHQSTESGSTKKKNVIKFLEDTKDNNYWVAACKIRHKKKLIRKQHFFGMMLVKVAYKLLSMKKGMQFLTRFIKTGTT